MSWFKRLFGQREPGKSPDHGSTPTPELSPEEAAALLERSPMPEGLDLLGESAEPPESVEPPPESAPGADRSAPAALPTPEGGPPSDDVRLIQFAPEQGATLPARRRLLELADELERRPAAATEDQQQEMLRLIQTLISAGESGLALELLRDLTDRLPQLSQPRLRLAELLYDSKSYAEAIALLRQLASAPECAPRAHFLLGEYHSREAELEDAMRHYEAVLAVDFLYPRARQRAAELRSRLDRPVAVAAPTIIGAEDLGPASRFVLQRELGRGGSGTVYLALDRQLGRPVAVKTLHRQLRQQPEAWARLFCEARIATSLQHPGIVAIYDLDEELSLVAMEYCAGGTLASHLSVARPPPDQVLERLAQVMAVLDVVHRCGVVHRDLKPANLLCRSSVGSGIPPLVVSDFGIARAGAERGAPLEAEGSLIYMAPEQRRGDAVDPRCDLYSCGVILLESLLGRPPLDAQAALSGVPLLEKDELWRELSQGLPPALRGPLVHLARALVHPVPERRPAGAAAVSAQAEALARLPRLLAERDALRDELSRRAAGVPRSPAVERWLAEQTAAVDRALGLESSSEPA